jgi:hypothetical protein
LEDVNIYDATTGAFGNLAASMYNLPTAEEGGETPEWEKLSHHHGVQAMVSKDGEEITRHWHIPRYIDEPSVELDQDNSCLVPRCDVVSYCHLPSKKILWDNYSTAAPERQRQFVAQYNIVKRV